MKSVDKLILSFAFIADIIIFEQILKFVLIIKKIPKNGIFLLSNNWLSIQITKVLNTKLAFSLELPTYIIYISIIIIIIGLFYYFFSRFITFSKTEITGLVLILSGSINNLIDRITYNGVVDYINIQIYNFRWPTFNFADTIIVVGVFLIIYNLLKPNRAYDK